MTNKLYDSKGQLIGYIRTVEKNQHDDLMKVILSTGHELVFGPCDLTSDRDGNWRIRSGALYPRCVGNKTASATNTAAIKNVKKNYIYLNEYTMYVVEDITGTHTDPYHYKLYFHTDILPDVEVRS